MKVLFFLIPINATIQNCSSGLKRPRFVSPLHLGVEKWCRSYGFGNTYCVAEAVIHASVIPTSLLLTWYTLFLSLLCNYTEKSQVIRITVRFQWSRRIHDSWVRSLCGSFPYLNVKKEMRFSYILIALIWEFSSFREFPKCLTRVIPSTNYCGTSRQKSSTRFFCSV